jgi:hypothetical protein
MWQRLLQDPSFRKAVKHRYEQLRKGPLSLDSLYAYIDRHSQLIDKAKERHFQTFPELLVTEGENAAPNMQFSMVGMFAAYRVSSYNEEIAILKRWLADRLAFLDRHISRFDTDWQPTIHPLIEKKMQFPGFPGGFPGSGFPGGVILRD